MNNTLGIGIYAWLNWLEGSMGLRDVLVARNTFVNPVRMRKGSPNVNIGKGTSNITVIPALAVSTPRPPPPPPSTPPAR